MVRRDQWRLAIKTVVALYCIVLLMNHPDPVGLVGALLLLTGAGITIAQIVRRPR